MPQFAEIIVKGHAVDTFGNKPIMNRYHYGLSAPSGLATKLNLWAAFNTQVMVPFGAAVNNAYIGDYATIRWVDDAQDPPVLVGAPPNGSGGAGDSLPLFNAVYVAMKTGIKGRIGRGSKHFSPISEADTLAGNLTDAAILAQWAALAGNLDVNFIDLAGLTWIPMVLSNKPPAQYLVNPVNVVANTVIAHILNKTIGKMSRRKEKTVVGINSQRPTVSGVLPINGAAAGGTAVTLTGTNFIGTTSVLFGAALATAVVVVTPTTITCVSPAHIAGAINVTVTTVYGTSPIGAGNVFTFL